MVGRKFFSDNLYLKTVSSEFLYYSWIWLRKEKYFLKDFFKYNEKPLSRIWFSNVSYLLKANKYSYVKVWIVSFLFNWFLIKNYDLC